MDKIMYFIYILALIVKLENDVYQYEDYQKYALLAEDYERISAEDYNVVFFSTFPIEHYAEEDFAEYRDVNTLKASYCIPDVKTLNEYFTRMSDSINEIDTVYLGVRPDIITVDDLLNLVDTWPHARFEIIIAYPSLEYWRELDEEEYSAVMAAYTDFINTLMPYYVENEWLQDHLSLYFYNSTEWLVGNKANYEGDFNINEGVAPALIMYSDQDHGYKLTLENYEEILEDFKTLVNECRTETESAYPDLSNWDVVFFGDSVIAFTETTSIPCVFSELTGAHTYNCGKGGCRASLLDGWDEFPGFPIIADAFLAEDLSLFSEDSQIYAGMTDYFEYADKNRQQCFVISFGLNDYFTGIPIKNDDPYDAYTYIGGLRVGIERLQDAYPDAVIILMTPNFISYFHYGSEPLSDVGGVLPDYVAAALSFCDEINLPCYDSYSLLGIATYNYPQYLLDGAHPNECTRYAMAQGVAELIGEIAEGME